ncbi:MAG: hypothetical protein HN849_22335, partial [Victivallales bacterium]|nr:hypothetical protein [Victivallales bacterium]
SSRVPMIIHDPRQPGGGIRCQQLSANTDIMPTLLDFAGLPMPEGLDGVSLRPLLDAPKAPVRGAVSILNCWNMPPTQCLAVTDGTYKYIYYWYQSEGMVPTEELYKLAEDPGEMHNLAGCPDHADALARLRALYDEAVCHIRDTADQTKRYEDYAALFDRHTAWEDKQELYEAFFDKWVRWGNSWRGGEWFEAHDLTAYPEDRLLNYGKFPREL